MVTEKGKQAMKDYYQKNKERIKKQRKEYRKKNKDILNKIPTDLFFLNK